MDIDELRTKQAIFEIDRKKINKKYFEIEKIRNDFVSKFSLEKINNLSIDDYVVGKGSRESFCYLLENKLKSLGDMHGATSSKFGIYYSKNNKEYAFVKRFGDNFQIAFDNIKSSIISLIIEGESGNIENIRKSQLSSMFKGKILATYFPETFLSIFSKEHLDHFLDQFSINYIEKNDELFKREYLLNFKNSDSVMKNWRNYDFSKFLYDQIGRPPKLNSGTPEDLKEYSSIDLPKMNDVKYEFVDLKLTDVKQNDPILHNDEKIFKKIDFDRENKINRKIGERGESVVMRAEKELLSDIGLKKLVNKVTQKSKESDSYGYDILSFDKNGIEKFIEVKSTRKKSSNSNVYFAISSNEYRHAVKIDNYYIYIVFEADTIKPKIFKLYKPFNKSNNIIKVEPKSYKVSINLS